MQDRRSVSIVASVKRAIRSFDPIEGTSGPWSYRIESDGFELERTELRVRYQQLQRVPGATLHRKTNGTFKLKMPWRHRSHPLRQLLLDDTLRGAVESSFVDRVVVDSFGGDNRRFRSDALRLGCRRLVLETDEVVRLVNAGVMVADALNRAGLVEPRPRPPAR